MTQVVYGDSLYLYGTAYNQSNTATLSGWVAQAENYYTLCNKCANPGVSGLVNFIIIPGDNPSSKTTSSSSYPYTSTQVYSDPYAGKLGQPVKTTDKFFLVEASVLSNLGTKTIIDGKSWYSYYWYNQSRFIAVTGSYGDVHRGGLGSYIRNNRLQVDQNNISGSRDGYFIYGQTQFRLRLPENDPDSTCKGSCKGCKASNFGWSRDSSGGNPNLVPYQNWGCPTKDSNDMRDQITFNFVPIQPYWCQNNTCTLVNLANYKTGGTPLYKTYTCDGVCTKAVPPNPCTIDQNCQPWQQCKNGVCDNRLCDKNADCPANTVCQSGTPVSPKICQPNTTPVTPSEGLCYTTNDCTKQVCVGNTGGNLGTCQGNCKIDTDCPRGQYCNNGNCQEGCLNNGNCPTDRPNCTSGNCSTAPTGCSSSSPCTGGQVCQNGTCVNCSLTVLCPTGQTCGSNGKCAAPTTYTCSNGTCVVDAKGTFKNKTDCEAKCGQGTSIWLWIILAIVVIIFFIAVGVGIFFLVKGKPTPPPSEGNSTSPLVR